VDTKTEVQEQVRARLDEAEAEIEALMAQATQSDYDEMLTDLRVKQELAKARLAELEGVDGETWHDLKSELDRAVSEVQNALQVAAPDSE
jgi:hypothetical protein